MIGQVDQCSLSYGVDRVLHDQYERCVILERSSRSPELTLDRAVVAYRDQPLSAFLKPRPTSDESRGLTRSQRLWVR
jgi:hypothetical protein